MRTPCELWEPLICRGSNDIELISDGDGYEGRCLCDRGTLDPVRDFASLYAFVAFFRRLRMQKAAMRITNSMKAAPPIIPPISGFVRPLLVGALVLSLVALTFAIAVAVGVSFGTAEAFDVFAATEGDAGVDAVTNVEVRVCIFELLSVVVMVSVKVKVDIAVE